MKIHKLTLLLLVLVLGTLGLAFARRNQTPANKPKETIVDNQEKKGKYPVADYDEAESSDPKKKQARKEKNLRQNTFRMVARNPPDWQAELLVMNEGAFSFPALPVVKSTYIVIGEVKTAEAHVSEDKKNVYSEFTVAVTKVLKTANSSIIEDSTITVDRLGGFVRYPNGRAVLYRISDENMPAVGGRYLFFLTAPNDQDLTVLTAYALGASGVTPLDDAPQFEKFRGIPEDTLLQNVRDALASASPY